MLVTIDARPRIFDPLLAFLALAVFWTWPLARHLSTRIPHDPGDPILNIWLLWWNAHAIPFTERWWNPPIFFPMRGALALSEHLAGIGLVTTPLQWLHANALSAYNIAFILSFALSGFFTFFLVRRLDSSLAAALRARCRRVCRPPSCTGSGPIAPASSRTCRS